jgi:hypothetical protein
LTQPLSYIQLNGKLTLYATRNCTDQLRKLNNISIDRLETKKEDGLYTVIAYARDSTGRSDVATAALHLKNLSGDALANAIMKCETKAKRRVTLSICGLGFVDESEVETIPNAKKIITPITEENVLTSSKLSIAVEIANCNSLLHLREMSSLLWKKYPNDRDFIVQEKDKRKEELQIVEFNKEMDGVDKTTGEIVDPSEDVFEEKK